LLIAYGKQKKIGKALSVHLLTSWRKTWPVRRGSPGLIDAAVAQAKAHGVPDTQVLNEFRLLLVPS